MRAVNALQWLLLLLRRRRSSFFKLKRNSKGKLAAGNSKPSHNPASAPTSVLNQTPQPTQGGPPVGCTAQSCSASRRGLCPDFRPQRVAAPSSVSRVELRIENKNELVVENCLLGKSLRNAFVGQRHNDDVASLPATCGGHFSLVTLKSSELFSQTSGTERVASPSPQIEPLRVGRQDLVAQRDSAAATSPSLSSSCRAGGQAATRD